MPKLNIIPQPKHDETELTVISSEVHANKDANGGLVRIICHIDFPIYSDNWKTYEHANLMFGEFVKACGHVGKLVNTDELHGKHFPIVLDAHKCR